MADTQAPARVSRRWFIKASATLTAGLALASTLPGIGPLAQKAHDGILRFQGVPLTWDKDCAANRLYYVNNATLKAFRP